MKRQITRGLAAVLAMSTFSLFGEGRELSSDRPDATESPFTVEPHRVQLEMSYAEYTRDRHNPEFDKIEVTSWLIAPINIRIGLTPNCEAQVVVDTYLDVKVKDLATGQTVREKGQGDITLRAKWNFWGNDGGPTALGLMPFVKLPTAKDELGNDSIEGGVILPFAMELAKGWDLGAMTEADIVRNEADDGYDLAWVNTVTVGHDLTEKIGAFAELASEVGEGKPVLSFNVGVTYAVDDNLQLDVGANFGLSRAADDLTVFAGFAKRF